MSKNNMNSVIHIRSGKIFTLKEAEKKFPQYDVWLHAKESDWGEFKFLADMPEDVKEWEAEIEVLKRCLTEKETVHIATGKIYRNVDEIVAAYQMEYGYNKAFMSGYITIFRDELPEEPDKVHKKLMWYRKNEFVCEREVLDLKTNITYDCIESVIIDENFKIEESQVYLQCNRQVPNPRYIWKNEDDPQHRRIPEVATSKLIHQSKDSMPIFRLDKKILGDKMLSKKEA